MAAEEEKASQEEVPFLQVDDELVQHEGRRDKTRRRSRGLSVCLWILILEVLNVLFFVGGPALLARVKGSSTNHREQISSYDALAQVNTIWDESEPWDQSEAAWEAGAVVESGVVSLSEEWVLQNGIRPSAPTPGRPGEMVYQVDAFHYLYCLYFLRKLFLTEDYASGSSRLGPITRGHVQHCLNYLRRGVTCNADISLGPTTTYDDYGVNSTHQCRDFDAVLDWVEKNRWKNFLQWTAEHKIDLLMAPPIERDTQV
ncbi:hypothetical protein B0T19DRAFT_433015, partial [Cercophora scortea]